MVLAGGSPQSGQAHIGELALGVIGPCWVLSAPSAFTTLMDWLDRRGALFLDWTSAAFEDGERRGREELSEDSSSSAGRTMSSDAATSLPLPGKDGENGRASSRDCSARPASNRVSRRSFSSRNRFACSCNLAICRACSSCFASISWRQRRN